MEDCSIVGTPCSREESKPESDKESFIEDQARTTRFRRAAAKLNYIALDDPRVGYATKQIAQAMAKPTEEGEQWIKRALRYLKGQPVCVWNFEWQDRPTHLVGYSDSDWAGCPKTRRRQVEGGSREGITSSCTGVVPSHA